MSLIRLRENFSKDWDRIEKEEILKPIPLSLTENNKNILIENKNYQVLSAYKIPVWKIDKENQNKRIYPLSLAERICKENSITIGLDTHPDDEYEPKLRDIIAVEKNPTIEDTKDGKVLFIEVYFVDQEISEKVDRAVNLGFMFEQSSSGFGELGPYKGYKSSNIVNPETYQLERYADFLISDSSYQVSFGKENEINKNSDKKNTFTVESIPTLKKESTNYMSDKEKSLNKEKNSMTVEDKLIKQKIRRSFKEVKKNIDLSEKLTELKEISSYLDEISESEDLKTEVLEVISVTEKEIAELAEKGKTVDKLTEEKEDTLKSLTEAEQTIKELTKKVEDLEATVEKACTEMDKSKDIYSNLKEMYQHEKAKLNSMVEAQDYIDLKKKFNEVSQKLEIAIEELDSIKVEESNNSEEEIIPVTSLDEAGKKKEEENPEDMGDEEEVEEKSCKKKKEADDSESEEDKKKPEDKKDSEEEKPAEKEEGKKKKESSLAYRYKFKHNDKLKIEKESKLIENYIQDLHKRYGDQISEKFQEELDNSTTLSQAQSVFYKYRPSLGKVQEITKITEKKLNKENSEEDRDKKFKESISQDPIALKNNWL